jgi:hypothetical protein
MKRNTKKPPPIGQSSILNSEQRALIGVLQELEMRIDTQKQTLNARDESIKKLLEMLQNKGEGQSDTPSSRKRFI